MFVLIFPVWPLICGAAIVKEKIPAIHTKVTVHADDAEQSDAMGIQFDSDVRGD